MKRIFIKPADLNDRKTIDNIASCLQAGEVLAYPTDTIYGLGCVATDAKAVERVYRIKRRGKDKSLLVLVSDKDMADHYFHITPEQNEYLKQYWPGPYSFILYSKDKFAPSLANNEGKVAVRLPNSQFLIKIVNRVGQPIVSTSLNISGDRPTTKASSLEGYFKDEKPDVVVDIGDMKQTKPSQVWDITDPDNIRIIRS